MLQSYRNPLCRYTGPSKECITKGISFFARKGPYPNALGLDHPVPHPDTAE